MRIDMLADAQLWVIESLRLAAGRGYRDEVRLWLMVWRRLDGMIKEIG